MRSKIFAVAVASSLTLTSLALTRYPVVLADAHPDAAQMTMPMQADQGVPSYHAYAPKPPLPATLDPKQFPDALNRNAYAMAARIKPILFQQPCYCYCDRSVGHKSLLDCFVSDHGSMCDPCRKEAIYSYQQSQKGKTAEQIRAGIIRGEWNAVDLRPYLTNAPVR